MIKCPCCKSSNTAMIYGFEADGRSNRKRVVSYKHKGKEILIATNERLCIDCGVVFVARKDCNKIKVSLERSREEADKIMEGVNYE